MTFATKQGSSRSSSFLILVFEKGGLASTGEMDLRPDRFWALGRLLCSVAFALLRVGAVLASDGPHAGPLFDNSTLTLGTGQRIEAAGPFFYNETNDTRHTWAI